LIFKSKDCENEKDKYIEIGVPESYVVKRISSVLHFTAENDLKPSFDVLIASRCESISCLVEYAEKKFRDDVAMWITARLEILKRFLNGSVSVPMCLQDYDEIMKRMILGLLYVVRPKIPLPIIIDDTLSFIVNRRYADAFVAMMRPFKASINEFLETREMLRYNPVIIAPGGHGGFYRLARPDKYVILFDHSRWEIPRREIERLANS
jgi:hypothetical protein